MPKDREEGTADGPLVLIVDDEPAVLALVDATLEDYGVRTRKAGSIEEAVRLAQEEGFDLAILDINLPDGSGLDLAGRIKSLDPRLPVIMMTGDPDSGKVGRSIDINVDAFLVKPIEVGKLQRIVGEFLTLRGLQEKRKPKKEASVPVQDDAGGRKKVLVIDDSEEILALVKEYLDVLGVEAILTSDPKKGLGLAKREKPDIILLDIVMPETWGSDLAAQLQDDPETSDIPIIFMTALADAEDTEKMPKGGYRFLSKGLSPEEFQKKLKEFLL